MNPGFGPLDQSSTNGTLFLFCLANTGMKNGKKGLNLDAVRVLVRTPLDMLTVDVIRCVCDRDSIPDSFLCVIHAHLTRFMRHVRGALDQGEAHNCWFGMPAVPEPYRLQSCSSLFHRQSQNLLVLREQLSFIEEEDIHSLHETLNTKYTMFKRFQGTMQVATVAFIMAYMRADDTPDNYLFRMLVHEWLQFCIFMCIGWNFTIHEALLHMPVMSLMKSTWEIAMPPIYSVVHSIRCSELTL